MCASARNMMLRSTNHVCKCKERYQPPPTPPPTPSRSTLKMCHFTRTVSSPLAWTSICLPLRIHVWYIYLHLVDFYGFHVGKYTSPMDPMGMLFLGGCSKISSTFFSIRKRPWLLGGDPHLWYRPAGSGEMHSGLCTRPVAHPWSRLEAGVHTGCLEKVSIIWTKASWLQGKKLLIFRGLRFSYPRSMSMVMVYLLGVSKNGATPKWMGKKNGKPYYFMDGLGGKPHYFRKHPYVSGFFLFPPTASGEHPEFPSLPSLSRFDLDLNDALWVLRRADRTNVASPMMLRRYKEPLGTFEQ